MKLKNTDKFTITVASAVFLLSGAAWQILQNDSKNLVSPVTQSSIQKINPSSTKIISPVNNLAAQPSSLVAAVKSPQSFDTNLGSETEAAWQLTDLNDESLSLPDNALKNTVQSIEINANFVDQPQLSLSLPNGQVLNMQRHTVENLPSGSKSWVGKDPQQPELFAVITQNGNAIAGSVQTQDGTTYLIASLKNGKQIVYQQDSEKLDRMSQHNDQVLPPVASSAADKISATKTANLAAIAPVAADNVVSNVKVLFVFTSAAITASGFDNLQAQIDNEVTVANTITYPSSGINMRITQVGPVGADGKIKAVTYLDAEGADFNVMLSDLTSSQKLNTEALRVQYGADLVQGVIAQTSYCGYGWVLTGSDGRYGYSVISSACIDNSMTHEMGHNMGLNHDYDSSPSADDRHGYRYCNMASGGFRTIMAYACGSDPRVKRISNPDVFYNGLPTGLAGKADNAHFIENTARFSVANFKADGITSSATSTPKPTATPAKTPSPTALPTATPVVKTTPTPKIAPTPTKIPTAIPAATSTPFKRYRRHRR